LNNLQQNKLFNSYKGVIFAFFAAVCFSTKAILVKLLYAEGLDSHTALMLRMMFSIPFFLYIAWDARNDIPKENELAKPTALHYFYLFVLGLLGYYLSSLFDFIGLQYISAGLERLIVFIYPTIVVILRLIFFKRKIRSAEVLALLLTYSGMFLVFYHDIWAVRFSNNRVVEGSVYVFLSTITYAFYLIGSEKLIPLFGAKKFTAYAMSISCVIVIIHGFITTGFQSFNLSLKIYGISLLMAMLSTVLASLLLSEAIKQIGSGKTAIIGSFGPVATISMAFWLLNETVSETEIWGTFLILGGVLWVSYKK